MQILGTVSSGSEGNIFIELFHFRGLLLVSDSNISRSLDRYLQRLKVSLANCYFARNSSGIPALLPCFDAPPGGSFHPFPCYPGPPARTWRRPLHSCGVASP